MVGAWLGSLSRLGGGIGTRGPGEKAIEIDRRTLRDKIDRIKNSLESVRQHRDRHRQQRRQNRIPSFALIGYTNAGKSTLLNKLTHADVLAEDKLFATLDPTTRKVFLPNSPPAVITDTVGFIRKLPTQLIEAFKATLEEAGEADVLLHVIDISHPEWRDQTSITDKLIDELGWSTKPIIHVYNKVDKAAPARKFEVQHLPRTFVSATTGEGLTELKQLMIQSIGDLTETVELFFPIEQRHKVFELSRETRVIKQEESRQGIVCSALLTPNLMNKWKEYFS
jgi:GTP-binding protein HflX